MKTRLSILLAVLLLFSFCSAVSAAPFADVEGKKSETAITVLNAIGIIEGKSEGVFAPEDTLTRAEMATLVLRMMGMNASGGGKNIFTDVPASHWAYANISAAYQLGIVNGTSADTFTPDGVVTYEQAVKMVVAALGYTVQADALGGYPSGYLAKAANLDILKNVKIGGEMSRGDMAILLYNALDVELFQKTAYGEDAYEFKVNEAATILSHYLKINKVTDVVTATPLAKLENVSRLLSDEVAVGSPAVIMKKGETDAQNLLGMRCDIYTRKDEVLDIPVIVAIVPRANSNVLTLKAQEIENVTNGRMTYVDADGKEQEVNVGALDTVLLNGKKVTSPTDATFQPQIGTVQLVANNAGDFELAIVESYTNYVVKYVNQDEDKVYYKNNESMVIDLTDNSVATVMTDEKGKALTLDDLQEWDVVSVAQDDAEKPTMRRIYRSYVMVSGTINEMSNNEVVIGEATYKVAPSLDTSLLQVGKTASFHLDFTGAIAAVDESFDIGCSYGWLRKAEYTKGLNAKVQLKIFTDSGEWKVFTLAEKVEFNGDYVSCDLLMEKDTRSGKEVYEDNHAPKLFDAAGAMIPQLVAYDVNANNEIIELHTAQNLTNPAYADSAKIGGSFSMDWYANNHAGNYSGGWVSRFDGTAAGTNEVRGNNEATANIYFGRVVKNDLTKIFYIPMDVEDDKQYVLWKELGMDKWRETECVSFYDVSERYQCGAIVVRSDIAGKITKDAYPESTVASGIVTGISTVQNEDGEPVTAIKLKNYSGADVTAKVIDPEFECLYAFTNADLSKDKDWYAESLTKTNPETGKKVRYNYQTVEALIAEGRGIDKVSMKLPVSKLQPGDVIQYQLDNFGNLEMANVCFRGNYGGEVEFTAKISPSINYFKIAPSTRDNYYNGGALLVHGNVKDVFETGIFVDVNIADANGQKTDVNAMHAMVKNGAFYLWDRDKATLRTITADDVMPGDEVFVIWATTTQRMFIVYRPTEPNIWKK